MIAPRQTNMTAGGDLSVRAVEDSGTIMSIKIGDQ